MFSETKYLMIIGGGILQVPVIQTASSMGIKTIVTDYNPEAYGLKIADYPIIMSTRDVDGTVRVAKELLNKIPIHGVITVGTDASKTVSAVANALGLPGIKFEDAECATNKIKMRTRFKAHNVPCPDFYGVWSYQEAVTAFQKLEKPVVVKPADNMGARGVRRVDNEEELASAFESAKKSSPSGEIIIEEYMQGDELSIDSLVYNDEVYICGIADRIIEHPPFFVETGHVMPSQKSKEILKEAEQVMRKGIKALGISIGAAKGDIKVTKDGVKIVEMAARLSGGFMSTFTYPYSSGVNLMKAAIYVAFGEKPPKEILTPTWEKVSIERGILPEPGILQAINNLDAAEKIPGVKNIFITSEIGDEIHPPVNNVGKVGHIIVVADTHEKAFEISRKALKTIKVETEADSALSLEEIKRKAIHKFDRSCFVCQDCNGIECKGKVPGMGSIGSGKTFLNNIEAIRKYNIIPNYIHNHKKPQCNVSFLGLDLDLPLLVAPVTGCKTNMGGALDEEIFMSDTLKGAKLANSLAFLGDGASADKYLLAANALEQNQGHGISIFKPRVEQKEIIKRIEKAQSCGAKAVGIDIDAAAFITMKLKGQAVEPKTVSQLKELVQSSDLPFFVKGILSAQDALNALEAGVKYLYISNHGGRVLDYMPATLDILKDVKNAVGKDAKIIIDGGFREGIDIFKALALGADYVAIGRPSAIAVVGGGAKGLALQIEYWKKQLEQVMLLTGCSTISDICEEKLVLN